MQGWAADAAVRIIERLMDAGSPAISMVGGLAEPLTAWLPSRIRDRLAGAQSDPLDGAILMARRAFLPHTYTFHPNSRALAFAAFHA